MSHDATVVEARRRFGNYARTKEWTRDTDVVGWLDALVDDLRYALGAPRGHEYGAWEVSVMACLGLLIGLGLTLTMTRFIVSFLFGLAPTDDATIAASMSVLAGVALVAAYVPARRASRVDPMEALRED
jgi:predicted lysophospholipase L1 biosynthesis ABC-type transport system permease subunit